MNKYDFNQKIMPKSQKLFRSNSEIYPGSNFNPKLFLNKNNHQIESDINTNKFKLSIDLKTKEAIKAILKDVLYNSLAQAILRLVYNPNILLKAFLFIFTLTSTGLTSYLIIQSILTYFTYGVSTTSRTYYETPTLFPKVTFCNLNEFTTEYAYNLTQMNITNGNNLTNDQKKKVGHSLKDILIQCKYNGQPCTTHDFVWSYIHTYGNCYTFNSAISFNQSKFSNLKESFLIGPDFGLQLMVYVNFYEKLTYTKYKMTHAKNGLGALIRIGNSSYSSYFGDGGIYVASGFQTFISVDREFKSMLAKPYSNCDIDSNSPSYIPGGSDLYNMIGQTNLAYSQQLCFAECIQKVFISKYNCTAPFLVSIYNASTCNLNTNYLLDIDLNLEYELCTPQCPLECNQTLYETSISFSQLIGSKYVPFINDNPNLNSDFENRTIDAATSKESFVYVNIFYSSLSYTLTTETPQMNIVSLLASIGGNLGLFMGVSVFSLCEIVEAFIKIYYFLKKEN